MADASPAHEIANFLRSRTSYEPEVGIVCGSGLGGLSDVLENPQVFKYHEIEGFPVSTVQGHSGELVFGLLEGRSVICMKGRFHSYEGHTVEKTALPIRVMFLLGVKFLIVTNAAGGMNPSFRVGDVMLINDHINIPGLAGKNPLVGPNDERFGPRFPPMSDAYDQDLRAITVRAAKNLKFSNWIRHGCYSFVSGPSYETAAECRFLRLAGADAVGMSTVPEVIIARHCGLRVLGMSLITNIVVMDPSNKQVANHQEVLMAVESRAKDLQDLVRHVVRDFDSPVDSRELIQGNSKKYTIIASATAIAAILAFTLLR